MTNKNDIIENIPSLKGRRVKQLRKDAKQRKKKLNISLQEALNLTVKEQGLGSTWQRLMTRSTELFGKLSGTPYEAPLAKSTVFMGVTGANISRLVTDQWRRAAMNNSSVIDVFIDLHGDTLTYATVASQISMYRNVSSLKLFSCYDDGKLISNLYASDPKTLRSLINALFEKQEDQYAGLAYLYGDEDVPKDVAERIEHSKKQGLLMWLDKFSGDRGFKLDRALGFSDSTVFLLPPQNQCNEDYSSMLADILRLCQQAIYFDKDAPLPLRITITGLNGREEIPKELIHQLFTDPNIEIILGTEPNGMSEWQDEAVQLAEQAYLSRVIDDVDIPKPFMCSSSRLKALPRAGDSTAVLMYRKGNLVDMDISLVCEPAFLRCEIAPPLHYNGQSVY